MRNNRRDDERKPVICPTCQIFLFRRTGGRPRVKKHAPDGLDLVWSGAVQPHLQKYSDFQKTQIKSISIAIPSHSEGRFADVTDAGRGAVDATARLTGDANADGEDVWS